MNAVGIVTSRVMSPSMNTQHRGDALPRAQGNSGNKVDRMAGVEKFKKRSASRALASCRSRCAAGYADGPLPRASCGRYSRPAVRSSMAFGLAIGDCSAAGDQIPTPISRTALRINGIGGLTFARRSRA